LQRPIADPRVDSLHCLRLLLQSERDSRHRGKFQARGLRERQGSVKLPGSTAKFSWMLADIVAETNQPLAPLCGQFDERFDIGLVFPLALEADSAKRIGRNPSAI